MASLALGLVEASACLEYTLKALIATRSDSGVGNEQLSGELKVAQGHLTLVCNILTLHNHEVQSLGLADA